MLQWHNVGTYIGSDHLLGPWVDSSSFKSIFRLFLYDAVSTIAVFLAVHCVWGLLARRKYAITSAYAGLSETGKFILVTHSVYALVLAEQIVPYSIMAVRFLYGNFLGELGSLYKPVFAFMLQKAVLYLVEGCVRSVCRVSWLLLCHHMFFFALVIIPFCPDPSSIFGLKLAVILDWHVVFEVLLYVSLVLSRLRASTRAIRGCIIAALLLYFISRIVQTMQLVQLFVAGFHPMQASGSSQAVYWVSFVLVVALSCIQVYTFWIYGQLFIRCAKRHPAGRRIRQLRPAPAKSCELGSVTAGEDPKLAGVIKELGMSPANSTALYTAGSATSGNLYTAGSAGLLTSGDALLDRANSASA